MSAYTVHAKPWAHGWELHIEGVGVTQSRNLRVSAQRVSQLLNNAEAPAR